MEGKRTICPSHVGKADRKHRKRRWVHIARGSIHTRICRQAHNAASDETYYATILFHFRERTFYVLCSRAACAAGRAAPTASAQSTSRTARTGQTEDDKPIPFRLLAFSTSFARTAYAVQRYMPAQGSHPMGLPVWQPAAMVAGLTRPHEVLQARTQYQDFDIPPSRPDQEEDAFLARRRCVARSGAKYPMDPNVLPEKPITIS